MDYFEGQFDVAADLRTFVDNLVHVTYRVGNLETSCARLTA